MTDTPETRSVVVERDLAHPPDKVWRALTQPHLVAEWLMAGDIRPELGHAFSFSGDWGAVACEVLEIDPGRVIAYTWNGLGLESTVTWTLTPTPTGTHLRLEQAGFRLDQPQFYGGARASWPGLLDRLEQALDRAGAPNSSGRQP